MQPDLAPATDIRPGLRQKLVFWVLMGALSVFFAEVLSGASMFPFLTPWGLIAVVPLYLLHVLVLGSIAFSRGAPRFSTLYTAGMLFGMYEAYITKVLWDPPWGDAWFFLGGVAVVETALLVLFWHPVMAFLLPLLFGEALGTSSRSVSSAMPGPVRRVLPLGGRGSRFSLLVLIVAAGMFQSVNSPTPAHAVASVLAAGAVIFALAYAWRRRPQATRYALADLLPRGRELAVCCACLAVVYIAFGSAFRLEALPDVGAQAAVWLIYGLLFVGLFVSLRRPKVPSMPHQALAAFPSWRGGAALLIVFAAASAAGEGVIAVLGFTVAAAFWLAFVACGLALLAFAIRDGFGGLETGG